MANRIVGNVYILDSQMVTASLQVNTASWLSNSMIQGIGAWFANSTGILELAFVSDTSAVVFKIAPKSPGGTTGYWEYVEVGGVRFEELTTKTLTVGTGFIYFK